MGEGGGGKETSERWQQFQLDPALPMGSLPACSRMVAMAEHSSRFNGAKSLTALQPYRNKTMGQTAAMAGTKGVSSAVTEKWVLLFTSDGPSAVDCRSRRRLCAAARHCARASMSMAGGGSAAGDPEPRSLPCKATGLAEAE